MQKIICVGNRFLDPDGAALWIYDQVQKKKEEHLEWIEGGIGGMNLLPHFETKKEILVLDYFSQTPNATLFSLEEVLAKVDIKEYSHPNAFYYLLNSLEVLLDNKPKISILSCNPQTPAYEKEIFTFIEQWKNHAA